jgi:hypothetical protein
MRTAGRPLSVKLIVMEGVGHLAMLEALEGLLSTHLHAAVTR